MASPGVNGITSATSPSPPIIDSQILLDHLSKVLNVALGASDEDLASSGSLLSPQRTAETIQRCTRFATESNLSLYIQKESPRTEASRTNGADDVVGTWNFTSEARRR